MWRHVYPRTVVTVTKSVGQVHHHWKLTCSRHDTGADPGFQVRGGALKKIAPSRGRRENFWGISCEKSRFYAKKKFPIAEGGAKIFGVFRVKKITILRQKIIFFPILGGRASDVPPPGSTPEQYTTFKIPINQDTKFIKKKISFNFKIFISFQTGFHTYSALKILLKCHFHVLGQT